MPEEIMVASWRVMTVSSCALTRLGPRDSSIESPVFFSTRSMTVRPRDFSSAVTASREMPVISPFSGVPVPSTALKTKVAADMSGRHREAGFDELAHLGGLRGARLRRGHRDPALADEARQRGVHRLHAVLAASLDERVD